MSEEFLEPTSNRTVVILGDFTHEGIETTIGTLGVAYLRQELFKRKQQTWLKRVDVIRELREAGELLGVIIYLPTPILIFGANPQYREAWQAILDEVSKSKSIIFIHENNISGDLPHWDLKIDDYWYGQFAEFTKHIDEPWKIEILNNSLYQEQRQIFIEQRVLPALNKLLQQFFSRNIDIAPFNKRLDVTVRIEEFLEEVSNGIFLRLYIPNGRYQAEQLGSFLRLFENYLHRVEGKSFTIDVSKTQHGLVYTFKNNDKAMNITNLSNSITRFEGFLDACHSNPREAELLLSRLNISPIDKQNIITKYARDFQRIIIDVRQEFEQKTINLRHRLENEAFELQNTALLPTPQLDRPSSLLFVGENSGEISVNVSNLSIQNNTILQTIVGQVVNGDITYNQEDKQLLELFDKYADRLEALQLKSHLEQLKDETSPNEARKTARQRIAGFLYKHMGVITEGAVKGLAGYLEKLITGLP